MEASMRASVRVSSRESLCVQPVNEGKERARDLPNHTSQHKTSLNLWKKDD